MMKHSGPFVAGTATRSGDDGDEEVEDAEDDAVAQLSSHSNDEEHLAFRPDPVPSSQIGLTGA